MLRKPRLPWLPVAALVAALVCFSKPLAADPPLAPAPAPEGLPSEQAQPTNAVDPSPAAQLATIQRDIEWLQQEIASKRRDQAQMSKDDATSAEQDIAELEGRLERAKLSFIATASDVELPVAEDSKTNKPQKRDLMGEAQDLIEPLFDAIRRVSEKPRRIEALRSRSFYLHDRITQIDRAVAGLDHAVKNKAYPSFEKELAASKKDLQHERDELLVRVVAIDRKLNEELEDHRTVVQVVKEDLSEFVVTRGKNLAIAFFVFALTLWVATHLRVRVLHTDFVRHKLRGLHRPVHVLYNLTAGLAAIFASIFTLHFLNDWFMASLIMLGLLAAIWTLKTVLHHFIAELKLLMNLGTAKQGERVVWNGIPWLIKSLGFRSILINESLQGGTVALPAATLATLLSREPHDNEPWFPTKPGDYVLLDDGVYGQIELQTPEVVVVAAKHYTTSNYLSKNPQNLSRGFELSAELAIRADLKEVTAATEAKLLDAARALLRARMPKAEPRLKTLEGGVIPARPGRLRVWLLATCPGELAAERDALKRSLQIALSGAARTLFLAG